MELIVCVASVAVQEKIMEVIFVVFPELGEFKDIERAKTLGTRIIKRMAPITSFFIFSLRESVL